MNRDHKAAAVAEIAEQIRESEAIFAIDFRGLTVTQAAEVRSRLRESGATLRVVKNSLTERAADEAGVEALKAMLTGPTALTFVRGDAAGAAKAISTFNRQTSLLEFKGGIMEGEALEAAQLQEIAKLPSREVLYAQLVGVVAAPLTGLARGLGGLLGGLAIALGELRGKKESGEVPAGEPQAAAAAPQAGEPAAAEESAAEEQSDEPAVEAQQDTDPDTDNEADASA